MGLSSTIPPVTTRATCSRGAPNAGYVCPYLVVGPWLLWAPCWVELAASPILAVCKAQLQLLLVCLCSGQISSVLSVRLGLYCCGCFGVFWPLDSAQRHSGATYQVLVGEMPIWWSTGATRLLLESRGTISFLMAAGGCLPRSHFFFFLDEHIFLIAFQKLFFI